MFEESQTLSKPTANGTLERRLTTIEQTQIRHGEHMRWMHAELVGRIEHTHNQAQTGIDRIETGTQASLRSMGERVGRDVTEIRSQIRGIYSTAWKTIWVIATGAVLTIFNLIWTKVVGG
jgi:hypothetical protein